jgi:uncharacterized membrane protein (DUF373 family)
MEVAERVIYAVVSVILFVAAAMVLVATAWNLVEGLEDGTLVSVRHALDGLLLVFILVELLQAVSATLSERRLVAEPFLLVGIIATIKEVVVVTLEIDELLGEDHEAFIDGLWDIAALSGLLIALGVTTLLVRRKEREPEE